MRDKTFVLCTVVFIAPRAVPDLKWVFAFNAYLQRWV